MGVEWLVYKIAREAFKQGDVNSVKFGLSIINRTHIRFDSPPERDERENFFTLFEALPSAFQNTVRENLERFEGQAIGLNISRFPGPSGIVRVLELNNETHLNQIKDAASDNVSPETSFDKMMFFETRLRRRLVDGNPPSEIRLYFETSPNRWNLLLGHLLHVIHPSYYFLIRRTGSAGERDIWPYNMRSSSPDGFAGFTGLENADKISSFVRENMSLDQRDNAGLADSPFFLLHTRRTS